MSLDVLTAAGEWHDRRGERGRNEAKIEMFLKREAELINDRNFGEWLKQMTEDVVYKIPVITIREDPRGSLPIHTMWPITSIDSKSGSTGSRRSTHGRNSPRRGHDTSSRT